MSAGAAIVVRRLIAAVVSGGGARCPLGHHASRYSGGVRLGGNAQASFEELGAFRLERDCPRLRARRRKAVCA